MSSLIFDIEQLYARTFGSKPYKVGRETAASNNETPFQLNGTNQVELYAPDGSTIQTSLRGVEIWLPTKLRELPTDLFDSGWFNLPYSVIRITGSSSIIRTPLNERRGTVKEFFSIDDYKITIKGFFIDRDRVWPYDNLSALKKLHELGANFILDNALTNIFLNAEDRVVITSFDLPEVEGGRKHVRPFVMQIESDTVFELEYNV